MFYKQKRILPFHEADAGPADGVVEVEAEESSLWPRVGRTALFFALGILLPLLLGQRADRYPWRYRQGVCGGRGRSRSRRSRAVGAHGAGVGLSGASTSMGLPGERAQGWALERRVSPTGWHVTRDRDLWYCWHNLPLWKTERRVREKTRKRREYSGRLCSDFLPCYIILCNNVGVGLKDAYSMSFGLKGQCLNQSLWAIKHVKDVGTKRIVYKHDNLALIYIL